jgi:hypothetical protein
VLHGELSRGDPAPLPAREQELAMPLIQTRADVPMTVDASRCVVTFTGIGNIDLEAFAEMVTAIVAGLKSSQLVAR